MLNKRLSKFIVLILIIIIPVFAGCSNNGAKPIGQYITCDLFCEPVTLDPGKIVDDSGKQLINSLFEGLVRLKYDGTYEKAMAENWTVENDGTKYIFKIRAAKWSNGALVTAYDFEYAWKRVLDPEYNSPYADMLYDIKNAEEYNRSKDTEYSGKTKKAEDVGIKALDNNTLVVELESQNPVFINKLINPVFLPLPQKSREEVAGQIINRQNIIGNGPYVITKHEAGQKYVLDKNMSYWDEKNVNLKGITYLIIDNTKNMDSWQMFNAKELDLTVQIPLNQILKGLKTGVVSASPLLTNYFYEFNVTKKPLDDIRVRQALSYALDRNILVNEKLQGGQKPARGIVPAGLADIEAGSDFRQKGGNLIPDNNQEEAIKLLAEAGYPAGKGFPKLKMLVSDQESHLYLANYLQEQWKRKLGVETEIIPLNWQERVKLQQAREYDIVMMGWSADYADPLPFLERYITHSGNNDTGWYNADFDKNIRIAKNSNDENQRFEALHRAEAILLKEMPVLPLYDYTKVYAVNNRLKGFFLLPLGGTVEFKWAYTE